MRVNIDVSGMTTKTFTGVGIYTLNLINALQNIPNLFLSASYKISRFKKREIIQANIPLPFNSPYIPFISSLRSKPYDIFHGPDFYIPNDKSIKKIITIHDMGVFHIGFWPEKFAKRGIDYQKNLFNKIKPDHVITVSNTIKEELIERFPAYRDKVTTIYHGADHIQTSISTLAKPYEFPYFVYVGTIEKRKNIQRLTQAFNQISLKHPDLKLILVGSNHGFLGKELIEEALKNKNIIHTDFVSDEVMRAIVSNSIAMIYPSEYEGFGFPILEAMKLQTPVITSNFGAMQEISAGFAYSCNTLNVDSLIATILYVYNHQEDSKNVTKNAFIHSTKFTWQKTAEQTMNVYKKVFNS